MADNLDNEKRLFRAEQRSGRKSKQKGAKDNRKKGGPSMKPYRSSWFSSTQSSGEHAAHSGSAGAAAVVAAPGLQLLVPQFLGQGARLPSAPIASSQMGPCFLCGKMGHYRKGCPLLQNASSSKNA